MVMGFTGSSPSEYFSAYYTGRLNNGSTPTAPIRYFAGRDWFEDPVDGLGDYSYTSPDPESLSIWTIQQYSETPRFRTGYPNVWGTRISAVSP